MVKRDYSAINSLGFGLMGLIVVVLVIYVENKTDDLTAKNMQQIQLTNTAKNQIAQGYLWFERMIKFNSISGLRKEVHPLFESTRNILWDISTSHDVDLETKKLAIIGIHDIDDLMKSTEMMWDRKFSRSQRQAGSFPLSSELFVNHLMDSATLFQKLNQKCYASFGKVQSTLNSLINLENAKAQEDFQSLRRLYNLVNWVIIGVLLFLGIMGYRLQKKTLSVLNENSKKIIAESERITSISNFADQIASGNFSATLEGMQDDSLCVKLIAMRDKLQQNYKDESKREWANKGLEQIIELLRRDYESIEFLYDAVIKFIVRYTGGNQAGLFLVKENETNFLELVACFAYDRKKYTTRQIPVGEGLIGQCFLSRETVYLTDPPSEYFSITSGLGTGTPRALLLVPLKIRETVLGVLELASFQKFEPHQIKVIENISENISGSINNRITNDRTSFLLEQTQQLAEEMTSQEEEMRQNLEELESIQEEMKRKEEHLSHQLEQTVKQNSVLGGELKYIRNKWGAVYDGLYCSEIGPNLTIELCNPNFLLKTEYAMKELLGQSYAILYHPDMPSAFTEKIWSTLLQGKSIKVVAKYRSKSGKHFWCLDMCTPSYEKTPILIISHLLENEAAAERMYIDQLAHLDIGYAAKEPTNTNLTPEKVKSR